MSDAINNRRLSDDDLHAYIDGELDAARAAAIAALIQSDADLARRHAAFAADKLRLRQIYGPLAEQPVPQAMLDTIARHRQQRRRVMPVRQIAYAMAASVALAIAGWSAYQTLGPPRDGAVSVAMTAYNDTRPLSAAEDIAGILPAALGARVKAPDMSKAGFTLAGVQVYETPSAQKAVKLEYKNAAGRRFAMYLAKSDGTPRFDMLKQGATRICIWDDEAVSAIMMGEMSAGEMMRLASLAYNGLNG